MGNTQFFAQENIEENSDSVDEEEQIFKFTDLETIIKLEITEMANYADLITKTAVKLDEGWLYEQLEKTLPNDTNEISVFQSYSGPTLANIDFVASWGRFDFREKCSLVIFKYKKWYETKTN